MKTHQPIIYWEWLGEQDYKTTWAYQNQLQKQWIEYKIATSKGRIRPKPKHKFLLVTHPHVITMGKNGELDHLLLSTNQLSRLNMPFIKTDRGGDITYHGPGQMVGYPILDLEDFRTDIGWYLDAIQELIVRVCSAYHIKAQKSKEYTGVWVNQNKICAIGIHTSRWVTKHGFAFNINTHLEYFQSIIPCGLAQKGVTSMQRELQKHVDIEKIIPLLLHHFSEVFGVEMIKL